MKDIPLGRVVLFTPHRYKACSPQNDVNLLAISVDMEGPIYPGLHSNQAIIETSIRECQPINGQVGRRSRELRSHYGFKEIALQGFSLLHLSQGSSGALDLLCFRSG